MRASLKTQAYNCVSFYCHAKDASVLHLRATQIIPREMLKQLENMTLFWENSSPQKTSSSPIPLLIQWFCLRGDTYHSRQYCSKYPPHHLWMKWWWSCGVVTVYVLCGDHNGSFKGTACFRENMNRGAPLGLVLDMYYVWVKTITTSPRKTKKQNYRAWN